MWYLLSIAALLQSALSQKCRTISLEGGGSHGAYEAGAIWALANLSNPEDVAYNVVTGISAGALNAFGFCQFAMGDEIAMSNYLLNLWLNLNGSSSVYNEWGGGLIDGLLFHQGIYDTSPLIETLRGDFKYGIKRNITVGSTNLDTGLFSTFDETVGSAILDAVVCSASPPFFFPPHQFEGYSWSDGGCIVNLDVFSSVERCLEVTSEENIIVDVVFASQIGGLPVDTKFKTPDVISRMFAIKSHDSAIWYTYNALLAYPKATFSYTIIPTALIKNPIDGRTRIKELYEGLRESIIYP